MSDSSGGGGIRLRQRWGAIFLGDAAEGVGAEERGARRAKKKAALGGLQKRTERTEGNALAGSCING